METLENGKSKLEEICEILRKETLEPAQNDAKTIIDSANGERQKIIDKANADAKRIIDEAHAKVEQERKLFENSMDLASKQSFDELRQRVDQHLFGVELNQLGADMMKKDDLIAQLIGAVVKTVEKEGLGKNLVLALSESISPETVSQYLVGNLAEKLKKNESSIEKVENGAVVKIVDEKMRIDISEQSLKELMGSFLRDSFRKILFKNV